MTTYRNSGTPEVGSIVTIEASDIAVTPYGDISSATIQGALQELDDEKLPLAGGTMSGTIANFTSTGIDDNATATAITIDSSENVGIGIATPDGRLHVHAGTAGAVASHTASDDLVVENSTSGGISILTPDASQSRLALGSPSDSLGALVDWQFSTLEMRVGTATANGELSLVSANGVEGMRLDASQNATFGGNVSLGDNNSLYVGNGNDLRAYHTGTNTHIQNYTGGLYVQELVNSGLIYMYNYNSSGVGKNCVVTGGATPYVRLYYDGAVRLQTSSLGVNIPDSLYLKCGDGNDLSIGHNGTDSYIDNALGILYLRALVNSGEIAFDTRNSAGSARRGITVGGSTPYVRLYYDGSAVAQTHSLGLETGTFSSSGSTAGAIVRTTGTITISKSSTSSSTAMIFYNPNGDVGSIDTSGTATAYNTTSDKRLKTSHGLLKNSADIVNSIEIHEYHFNNDESVTLHGVMAQDCNEVYPNAISHDEENDTWGADYSKLVPILLANVQELNKQIKELRK